MSDERHCYWGFTHSLGIRPSTSGILRTVSNPKVALPDQAICPTDCS